MKNRGTYILLAVTMLFLVFTCGFFLGRTGTHRAVILPQSIAESTPPPETTVPAAKPTEAPDHRLNINTASVPELSTLPGIGEVIARRIVDFRTANGPFQDVTQLTQIEGIGEKRMEDLLSLITIGG